MSSRRIAVLTGATGKLGRVVARSLVDRNHDITLVVENKSKGDAFAWQLKREYPLSSIQVFEVDLSCSRSVEGLVASLSTLTHVDVLVNAAAIDEPPPTRLLS